MPASASFIEHVKELLSPFGKITVRKMFGGAGIYCDGLFFAIIGDDDIWLKTDDQTCALFEDAECTPFTFEMNGKTSTMSYYSAPEAIFDDNDVRSHWITLAIGAARRNLAIKKPRKKALTKRKSAKKVAK